jgi:hypothetical protein
MKKISVLSAICMMSALCIAFGQSHTQSMVFDDLGLGGGSATSGTYNQNDTFSFDVYLTYAGYDAGGYDLWLETQTLNNFSASLFITRLTYGKVFSDPTQPVTNPVPFDNTPGHSVGYQTENRDLGATAPGKGSDFHFVPPGTYFVGHVSFAIVGAPLGTYTLQSTVVDPHRCNVGDSNFMDNNLPVETYTITIVPESSTFALLIVAAIGAVATTWRRVMPTTLEA